MRYSIITIKDDKLDLRKYLRTVNQTMTELSKRVGVNKGYISKINKGLAIPEYLHEKIILELNKMVEPKIIN